MNKKFIIAFFIVFFCILNLLNAESYKREVFLKRISTHLPASIFSQIQSRKEEFFLDLDLVLQSEKENLLILVDKKRILSKKFTPHKIVLLRNIKNRAYRLDRNNIEVSAIILQPLQKMGLAAQKDGITIVVSSGYRPYEYQENLFNKYVKKYGIKKTKKFSALPGTSQHQLGTAIDFGTITDSYAKTKEGQWLFKNAYKYGWSLSFPKGMQKVTGYKWECWHYRYIGVEACKFQKKWFNDIQQYALETINEWKRIE